MSPLTCKEMLNNNILVALKDGLLFPFWNSFLATSPKRVHNRRGANYCFFDLDGYTTELLLGIARLSVSNEGSVVYAT
jgi:prepilin-type processing-associated H-X9-DG protein